MSNKKGIKIMKGGVCTAVGVVGAVVASWFGGWDTAFVTLFVCMVLDFVSGLLLAGVWHKSTKSQNGALESRAGYKGLCRKAMILVFVLVAYRLDLMIGVDYVRNGVIIAFTLNELISLIENAGLMGVPVPKVITKAIDILQEKSDVA